MQVFGTSNRKFAKVFQCLASVNKGVACLYKDLCIIYLPYVSAFLENIIDFVNIYHLETTAAGN